MSFTSIPYSIINYSTVVNNSNFNSVWSSFWQTYSIIKSEKNISQSTVKINIINTSNDNIVTISNIYSSLEKK